MECKHCRYPESRVVETRKDNNLNQTYRRRECIKCGARFTTQENFRDQFKREPYKTVAPHKVLPK